jgi:hypothetical protein
MSRTLHAPQSSASPSHSIDASVCLHTSQCLCKFMKRCHVLCEKHQLGRLGLQLRKARLLSCACRAITHLYIIKRHLRDWSLLLGIRHSECGVVCYERRYGTRKRVEASGERRCIKDWKIDANRVSHGEPMSIL